jgi:broad specificity phosphatase PhoE
VPALHLVRHGQASFGAADYDRLSPLGVEQSRAAGAALRARGVTPAVVVHGALRRQRETAEALAGAWAESPAGVPPLREDARWAEYDHEALLTRLHEARGPTPADDGAARSADVAGGATAGRGPDGPEPPADPRAAFQEALERALGRWTAGGHDADYAESFGAYRTRASGTPPSRRRLAPRRPVVPCRRTRGPPPRPTTARSPSAPGPSSS